MKTTNLKRICLFVLFCLLLTTALSTTAFSQFSEGADQRTQEIVPINELEQLPPLNTGMSLDCMIAYIVMDSLAKHAGIYNVADYPQNTTIDTLKVIARYFYSVNDYNPILMREYIEQTFDSVPGLTSYTSYPSNAYNGSKSAIINRINEFGRDYTMLILSHYILRVRIDSVVIGIDTTFTNHKPWVNAACTVIDTIKGLYIPQNCHFESPTIDKPDDKINTGENNCFIFGYPENWRTGKWLRSAGLLVEDTFIRTVQKGEEYFVFLEILGLWDNTDFLTTINYQEQCGGLFRINEGIVEDAGNFWGLGTTPSFRDFQNHLFSLISNIKSWWIQ